MNGFSARVLADSVSPNGSRLTTIEMVYPRMVHSEHLRHRSHSFNVASSRAIPIQKVMDAVAESPVIPIHWGAAQSGMQAFEEIPQACQEEARTIVLRMRDQALQGCQELQALGLAKQVVNRYLEPWMWCTVICSGVDRAWRHFWALRCEEMAEPHIRKIAELTRYAVQESIPVQLKAGQLHLPLFGLPGDEDIPAGWNQMRVSSGRCARVSYETHLGVRDVKADFALSDRLIDGLHWSPTEHPAMALDQPLDSHNSLGGNFGSGWCQFRKMHNNEFTK